MRKRRILAGMLAVVVGISAGCSSVPAGPQQGGQEEPGTQAVSDTGGHELALAAYPEASPYPDEASFTDEKTGEWDSEGFQEAYDKWRSEQRALSDLPEADGEVLEFFAENSIRQLLSGSQGKNRVYSPVNLYIALAMLAETTDGETRQQILDALGAEGMESLRTHANHIWQLCYKNDGAVTSILANSLWLSEGMTYNEETLKTLADSYYASAYSGVMGSEEYDKMLQDWVNEQTGGLLEEQAAGLKMSPETVLSLASTIYFRAKWYSEFQPEDTKKAVFYGPDGEITCDFMNSSDHNMYYWADHFSAVALSLREGGQMWLLRPDEGISPEELLDDEEMFSLLWSRGVWDNAANLKVNLSMPKFDVASDLDLKEGLQALGIQAVWDSEAADFTPLTEGAEEIWLSEASHAARVKVDEQGVEAAAYTVMMATGAAMPPDEEVDFILDRPFLFAITTTQGLPLFTGIVNQPV